MKLGSLFDGIGGFPLAASRYGIIPVWASEIEPFPVKVTQKHFPGMKHLGDITQINGAEIEPVDIITFGSPCQDLSVAGKREGLQGERSGLFMDAVRIIREMRAATDGKFPRFAVWENVPGAFSSNRGQDFRAVLSEIAETEIPMPTSGKWAEAGMVRTERIDIAWRTLDAQYWGVPQRRKRIFLVADFTGQCAAEILFECQGLPGNIAESGKEGQAVTGSAGDSVAIPINTQIATRHNKLGRGTGFGVGDDGDPAYTLQEAHGHAVFTEYIPKSVGTLTAEGGDKKGPHGYKGMCTNQAVDAGHVLPVQLYDMTHAEEVMRPFEKGLAPTLNARMGTGGNQVPLVMREVSRTLRAGAGAPKHEADWESLVIEPRSQDGVCRIHEDGIVPTLNTAQGGQRQPCVCIQSATRVKSQNGLGISQEDVSYTLDSLGNHAVAYPDPANTLLAKANLSFRGDADTVVAVDCRNLCENKELSGTLQSKDNGGYSLNYQNPVRIGYAVRRLTPLECERLQGFPDNWTNIPGASDTARYKAIGNSVAIPCVQFIMRRIKEVIGSTER